MRALLLILSFACLLFLTNAWDGCWAYRGESNWRSCSSALRSWNTASWGCHSSHSLISSRRPWCHRIWLRCRGCSSSQMWCSSALTANTNVYEIRMYAGMRLYLQGYLLRVQNYFHVYNSGGYQPTAIYGPGRIEAQRFYFDSGIINPTNTNLQITTTSYTQFRYTGLKQVYGVEFRVGTNLHFVGNPFSNLRFYDGVVINMLHVTGHVYLPHTHSSGGVDHVSGAKSVLNIQRGTIQMSTSGWAANFWFNIIVNTNGPINIVTSSPNCVLTFGDTLSITNQDTFNNAVFNIASRARLRLGGMHSVYGARVAWNVHSTLNLADMSVVEFIGGTHVFDEEFIWNEQRTNVIWGGNSWIEFQEMEREYNLRKNLISSIEFNATVRFAPWATSLNKSVSLLLPETTVVNSGGLQVGGEGKLVDRLYLNGGWSSFEEDLVITMELKINGGYLGGCGNIFADDHVLLFKGGFFGCNSSNHEDYTTNPEFLPRSSEHILYFGEPGPHYFFGRNMFLPGMQFVWNNSDFECGGGSRFKLTNHHSLVVDSVRNISMTRVLASPFSSDPYSPQCHILVPSHSFIRKQGPGDVAIAAYLELYGSVYSVDSSLALHGGAHVYPDAELRVCSTCGIEFGGLSDAIFFIEQAAQYWPYLRTTVTGGVVDFESGAIKSSLVDHVLITTGGSITWRQAVLRFSSVTVGGVVDFHIVLTNHNLTLNGGRLHTRQNAANHGHVIMSGGDHWIDRTFTNSAINATGGAITFRRAITLPLVHLQGTGSVFFNETSTITKLLMEDEAEVGGSHSITITQPLDWAGGTFSGYRQFPSTVTFMSHVTLTSPADKYIISRNISPQKDFSWYDGFIYCWASSTITILSTATFLDDSSLSDKRFHHGPSVFFGTACNHCDPWEGTEYEGRCSINVMGEMVLTGGHRVRYFPTVNIDPDASLLIYDGSQLYTAGGLNIGGYFWSTPDTEVGIERHVVDIQFDSIYNRSGLLRVFDGVTHFNRSTYHAWTEDNFDYEIRDVPVIVGSEIHHVCRNVTRQDEYGICIVDSRCFGCVYEDGVAYCDEGSAFSPTCLPQGYPYLISLSEDFSEFYMDAYFICDLIEGTYLELAIHEDVVTIDCHYDEVNDLECTLGHGESPAVTYDAISFIQCDDGLLISSPINQEYIGSSVECNVFFPSQEVSELFYPNHTTCQSVNNEFTHCIVDESLHVKISEGYCYPDVWSFPSIDYEFSFPIENLPLSTSIVFITQPEVNGSIAACTSIKSEMEVCGYEPVPIYMPMPKIVPLSGAAEDWTISNGKVVTESPVGINTLRLTNGHLQFKEEATAFLFETFYLRGGTFISEAQMFTFKSGYISGSTGDYAFYKTLDVTNLIEFNGAKSEFFESLSASECRFLSGTVIVHEDLTCGFIQFVRTEIVIYGQFYTPVLDLNGGNFQITTPGTGYISSMVINEGEHFLNALYNDNLMVTGGYVVIEEGFESFSITVNGGILETRGFVKAIHITVNGGVYNASGVVECSHLYMNGGRLVGKNNFIVKDAGSWTGGTFADTGTTFFVGGLVISNSRQKFINQRHLVFESHVHWNDGNITGTNGAVMTVVQSRCIFINRPVSLVRNMSSEVEPKLFIFGCLRKTVPGTSEIQWWHLNNGTVTLNINTQILAFWGGECNGRYDPGRGASLQFKRFYQSINATCRIVGDGKVLFGGTEDALIDMMEDSMLNVRTGIDIEFGVTNFLPGAKVASVGDFMTVLNGVANFAPGSSFVLEAVVSKGGYVYGRGHLYLSSHFLLEGGESLWLSVLAERGEITGGSHTFDGTGTINNYMNVVGGSVSVGGNLFVPEMNAIGGEVSVSGDVRAQNLTQVGGVLTGTGIIQAVQQFLWAGGTIAGSGVLRSDGIMRIQGQQHTLVERQLINWNLLYWTSGDIIGKDGARFTNTPSGKFFIQTGEQDCKMVHSSGSVPDFFQQGELYKNDLSKVEIQFKVTHTSFMYVYNGTLAFSAGGTYTNLVHVEGNSTFELAGGNVTMGFGCTLRVVAGLFLVSGGQVDIDYIHYMITDRMTVSGGRIDFYPNTIMHNNGRYVSVSGGVMFLHRTDTYFGFLHVYGGELHMDAIITVASINMTVPGGRIIVYRLLNILGFVDLYAGDLEINNLCDVSGLLSWYGGSISGRGRILTGGSFDIYEGPTPKEFRIAEFFNDREGRWHGGDIHAYDGAVFRNLMESSFRLIPGGNLFYGGGAMSVFENLGLIFKAGDQIAQINIYIDQRSLVNITEGHLIVSGGQDSSGRYQVHTGTYLEFGGGISRLHPGSWVIGSGNVIFSGGTTFVTCYYNISSISYHTGGRSNWDPGLDLINLGQWLNISGGVMAFHGYPLYVQNVFSSGGSLLSDSEVEDAGVWIQTGGIHRLDGTLLIWGEIHLDGGDLGGAGRTLSKSDIYWTGGEISGTNIFDVPMQLFIHGPKDKFLSNRRIETFNDTWYMEGDIYARNGGSIVISTVAAFHFTPGSNLYYWNEEGRNPELGNAGMIYKYNNSFNRIEWYVENIAAIDILEGHVNFAGGGWLEGTLYAAPDTLIEFGGRIVTFATNSLLFGDGNLLFSAGVANVMPFAEFILVPIGSMTVNGGEVNVEDNAWLNVRSLIVTGPTYSILNFLGKSTMLLPTLFVHGGQVRSRAYIHIPQSFTFTGGLSNWMGTFHCDGDGFISGGIHTFTNYSVLYGELVLTGSGVIGGEGWLDARSTFYWQGGTISGASLFTSSGGIKILTPQNKYMDQRILQNENVIEWIAGDIYFSNLATINNSISGTFLVNFDPNDGVAWKMEHYSGVMSILDNSGHLLINSSTDSIAKFQTFIKNTGLIEIYSGEYYSCAGGLDSFNQIIVQPNGIFHVVNDEVNLFKGEILSRGSVVQTGGTLYIRNVLWLLETRYEIFNGTTIFFDSVNISILARPFLVTGGTVDFRLPPPVTDHWIIQGGLILYHCNSINLTHVEISSGILSGKGQIFTQNYFNFTGGFLKDTGFIYTPSHFITGPDLKTIDQFKIWVTEDLTWDNGDIDIVDGGSIEVNQTGTFYVNLITDCEMNTDITRRDGLVLNHGNVIVDSQSNSWVVNVLWNTTGSGQTLITSGIVNPIYQLFFEKDSFTRIFNSSIMIFTLGRAEFLNHSLVLIDELGLLHVSTDSVLRIGSIIQGSTVQITNNGRLRLENSNDLSKLELIHVSTDGILDLGAINSQLLCLKLSHSNARVLHGYMEINYLDFEWGVIQHTSLLVNTTRLSTTNQKVIDDSNIMIVDYLYLEEGPVSGIQDAVITVLETGTFYFALSSTSEPLISDGTARIINYGVITDLSRPNDITTGIYWRFDDHSLINFTRGNYELKGGAILRGNLEIDSSCVLTFLDCHVNTTNTFELTGAGSLVLSTNSQTTFAGDLLISGTFRVTENAELFLNHNVTISNLQCNLLLELDSRTIVYSLSDEIFTPLTIISGNSWLDFQLPNVFIPHLIQTATSSSVISSSDSTVITILNEFELIGGRFAPNYLVYIPFNSSLRLNGDSFINSGEFLVHGGLFWDSGDVEFAGNLIVNDTGFVSISHSTPYTLSGSGFSEIFTEYSVSNNLPETISYWRISSLFENSVVNIENGALQFGNIGGNYSYLNSDLFSQDDSYFLFGDGNYLFNNSTEISASSRVTFNEAGSTLWHGKFNISDLGSLEITSSHHFDYDSVFEFDYNSLLLTSSGYFTLINSVFQWNYPISISNQATFNLLNISLSFPLLTQSDMSVLTGSNILYINDLFTFNGGSQIGDGASIIQNDIKFLTTTQKFFTDRTIHIMNTGTYSQGHSTSTRSSIIIHPNATFTIEGTTAATNLLGTNDFKVINYGTFVLNPDHNVQINADLFMYNATLIHSKLGVSFNLGGGEVVDSEIISSGPTGTILTLSPSETRVLTIKNSKILISSFAALRSVATGNISFIDTILDTNNNFEFSGTGHSLWRGLMNITGGLSFTAGSHLLIDDVRFDWPVDDLIVLSGSANLHLVDVSNTILPSVRINTGARITSHCNSFFYNFHLNSGETYCHPPTRDYNLTVLNFARFTAGSMHNSGRIISQFEGSRDGTTVLKMFNHAALVIQGLFTLGSAGGVEGSNSAKVIVDYTGELRYTSSGTMMFTFTANDPVFEVYGLFVQTAGIFDIRWDFNLYGNVSVTAGTFRIGRSGAMFDGSYTDVSSGATLLFHLGHTYTAHPGSFVVNRGTLHIQTSGRIVNARWTLDSTKTTIDGHGRLNILPGSRVKDGDQWIELPGAEIIDMGQLEITNGHLLMDNVYHRFTGAITLSITTGIAYQASITVHGKVEFAGHFTWTSGDLGGSGLIETTHRMTINGNNDLKYFRDTITLRVNDTLSSWTSHSHLRCHSTSRAKFQVGNGGLFKFASSNTASLFVDQSGHTPRSCNFEILKGGTVEKTNSQTLNIHGNQFINNGTLDVGGSNLHFHCSTRSYFGHFTGSFGFTVRHSETLDASPPGGNLFVNTTWGPAASVVNDHNAKSYFRGTSIMPKLITHSAGSLTFEDSFCGQWNDLQNDQIYVSFVSGSSRTVPLIYVDDNNPECYWPYLNLHNSGTLFIRSPLTVYSLGHASSSTIQYELDLEAV
ncbi:hypothetical protein RCL1_004348 [Eukaryota sp. TZLM3-RCL]